jgi:pimeloyl-ACP methyl ester carboxylesterase
MRIQVAPSVSLVADAYGDRNDPPVVLLHGGGQTRHSWDNSARILGDAGWYAMTVDLRGHGDSDWSPDGDYSMELFAADVRELARQLPSRPALVGASLGGMASLLAVGESDDDIASGLVLVDIAPRVEQDGVARIRAFMRQGLGGFPDLESAADAIASYNPHRPRPKDLSGLTKNLRLKEDGRWYWHWDPKFMALQEPDEPGIDGLPQTRMVEPERLEDAARHLRLPVLLVRGASSDLLSEEGAAAMRELVPHA